MIIRQYKADDEEEWLRCRTLAYLSTNERKLERSKPTYSGNSIELVALVNGKIVGFLDIELEELPRTISYKRFEGNGMVWDIGVLPEFRRKGIATSLLNEGINRGRKLAC